MNLFSKIYDFIKNEETHTASPASASSPAGPAAHVQVDSSASAPVAKLPAKMGPVRVGAWSREGPIWAHRALMDP